ncbi:unnamed protein product [Mucor hiemalis]
MSKVDTRLERPLGLLEKYQTSKQITGAYGNITMAATLEHEPFKVTMQLRSTYANSSQFSMVSFKPIPHFLLLSATSLKLSSIDVAKVVEIAATPLPLQQLIKEQTDAEFDLDDSLPLWRLKVVPESPTTCNVVLALHHAIGDGMSLAIFFKSFLTKLNDQKTIGTEGSSIVQVNAESRLNPPYEMSNSPNVSVVLDVVPVVLKSLVPKLLPTSITRMIDPISVDGWKGDNPAVEGEKHDTEVHLIHVPLDIWKPITVECKKRGISAHAIVFVAMLLAWHRLYPSNCTEVATPINCRGLCNPPVSQQQIGNYVGAYTSFWTEKQLVGKDIWDISKKYHQDLQKNKRDAAKQAIYLKYLPEFPASYCDYWYDKRKSSPFGRTGGLELSDLGKFTTLNEEGWKVKGIYFCQSAQIFTSAFGMNSISVHDNLYCTIGWQKGSLDVEKVSKFHDTFIDIMKNVPL